MLSKLVSGWAGGGVISWQLLHYATIGLLLNATLYGAYLLLTLTWLDSVSAMTVVYGSGVLLGFVLNRKITFNHHGGQHAALLRYLVCYAIGYIIDLSALWLFAGKLGLPHQVVQGGVTIALAVILFAFQKYWVFPSRRPPGLAFASRATL